MKVLLQFVAIAAIFACCLADCQPGLYGLQNWYHCEGLTDLQSQLPQGAIGLDITNSNIPRIKTDTFDVLGESLVELNITYSNVEVIEPNAFRGLAKLQVLSLSNNKIQSVRASWMHNLNNLKRLFVWKNRINQIDSDVYKSLPNLEVFDVAYNNLHECFSPENLAKLTRLRRILIAGNPWNYRCRHSMTWYLGTHHINSIRDWSITDILIEECLAHEPGAETDDAILTKCVERKVGSTDTLQYDVAALNENVVRLNAKVESLENEVAALKRSN